MVMVYLCALYSSRLSGQWSSWIYSISLCFYVSPEAKRLFRSLEAQTWLMIKPFHLVHLHNLDLVGQ